MPVNVVWHAQEDGRGIFNCTAMINDMFDHYDVTHIGGARNFPKDRNGAVIVVHGGREIGQVDRLNADLDELDWALVIFLGDEEASFPINDVQFPERHKIWIQEPAIPGTHSGLNARYILDGWSHDCHRWIVKDTPKDLDWVFAGQVTHERRRACVAALQSIDWGGVIVESKGFCQGVSKREYMELLCRAWIVPCPSGPMAQDAARPWEALECGAIPILDAFSPKRTQLGFWEKVIGTSPIPVISDWEKLPTMIDTLKRQNLKILGAACQQWWPLYKFNWLRWLKQDLEELGCPKVNCRF